MIAPGDVLRNRYRIERSIGRGGMGEVFSAVVLLPVPGGESDPEATLLRPSADSFHVAIKVVSRSVVTEAAMARLQREAEAARRIKSPFIPELIEVGTTPEGEVFLAMELLYGDTLTARLKSRPVLSWEEAFLLGDDVLSGLIDAHAAGVVHRDLKPSNIFLCERTPPDFLERAKVLDFGVCKLDMPDQEKLTGTGESVGTVSYMAPEQIRGASGVTEPADLYSFATVMFEVLSGQLPHAGTGQMAILASKLEKNAIRLSDAAVVPVPEGLEAILSRLLARDPASRIATAKEVRDQWRALGAAVVAPKASAGTVVTDNAVLETETGLASGTLQLAQRSTSRAGLVVAGVSVAVSAVALLVLVTVRARPVPETPDFAAANEPVVSAAVVDRPAVPPPVPTDPAPSAPAAVDTQPAADPPASAGPEESEVPAPEVPAPAAKKAAPPVRPPRFWGAPPNRPTTRPHIADKPRY